MADKQYNRKPADGDRGFDEERDPLAELARVVGYGDYARRPDRPEDGEADTGMALEDELLRALGGDDEMPEETGRPFEQAKDEAAAPTPSAPVEDDADAMTVSLEDDLLRELEGDEELALAGTPAATLEPLVVHDDTPAQSEGTPVPSGEFAPVPTLGEAAPQERQAFAGLDVDRTGEDEPDVDGGEGGFVFPSAEELEPDTDFSAGAWSAGGFSEEKNPSSYDAGNGFEEPAEVSADEPDPAMGSFGTAAEEPVHTTESFETAAEDERSSAAVIFDDGPVEAEGHAAGEHEAADNVDLLADNVDLLEEVPADSPIEDEPSGLHAADEPAVIDFQDVEIEPVTADMAVPSEAEDARFEDDDLADVLAAAIDADTVVPDEAGRPQVTESAFEAADQPLAIAPDEAPLAADAAQPGDEVTFDDIDFAADEIGSPIADAQPAGGEAVASGSNDVGNDDATDVASAATDDHAGALAEMFAQMESGHGPAPSETLHDADNHEAADDDPIPDLEDVLREITRDSGLDEPAGAVEDIAGDDPAEDPATPSDPAEAPERQVAADAGEAISPVDDDEPAEADADTSVEAPPGSLAAAATAVVEAGNTAEGVFDPAAIAAFDESVEPVGNLDVPTLPGDDPAPVLTPEQESALDYDVDAALAQLVGGSAAAATGSFDTSVYSAAADEGISASSQGGQAVASTDALADHHFDFDDLERALDSQLGDGRAQEAVRHVPPPEAPTAAAVAMAASTPAIWQNWKMIATGVVIIAVVAGGVVTFGFDGSASSGDGAPRIIAADTTPAKHKPKNPGGKVVPNQNKIVYDRVDGSSIDEPSQKALVTSNEKPLDVVQRTLRPDLPGDPTMASGEPDGIAQASDSGVPGVAADGGAAQADASSAAGSKSQARLDPQQAPAPTKALPDGVAPHYVQTMTVNAEGKLVAADPQPTADTAAAPAETSASAASPSSTADEPSSADDQQAAPQLNTAAPVPVARPKAAAPQSVAAAAPSGQSADDTATAQATADAAPKQSVAAASAEQPSASPAAASGYFVQISSQPTEAGAKASYSTLSQRYASLLNGRGVDIQTAQIDGKGTYYRVRIPASSRDDAINLCQNYKSAGGSCFVAR